MQHESIQAFQNEKLWDESDNMNLNKNMIFDDWRGFKGENGKICRITPLSVPQ